MQMDLKSYSLDPRTITFLDGQHNNAHWFNIVAGYRSQLMASPAKTWLLFEADTFLFSAIFYALLSAGKSIVLPQNAQPAHIREIKQQVQASIGSPEIEPDLVTRHSWPNQK